MVHNRKITPLIRMFLWNYLGLHSLFSGHNNITLNEDAEGNVISYNDLNPRTKGGVSRALVKSDKNFHKKKIRRHIANKTKNAQRAKARG